MTGAPRTFEWGKAPTTSETSPLECTHITCDECDAVEAWPPGTPLGTWSCEFCGSSASPVFEHHSPVALGFKDDKKCHWAAYNLFGVRIPEVWVYKAKEPAA